MRTQLLLTVFFSGLLFFQSCTSEQEEPAPGSDDEITEGGLTTVANFSTSTDENLPNGTEIGTIVASSTSGTITYNLTAQSLEGAIGVNNETGVITAVDGTLFNSTNNPQITATVDVSDGTTTLEVAIEINVYTIWTGEEISFSKANGADPTNASNQDRITDNVWITRGNEGGQIYNANTESGSSKSSSPDGTQWALGTTSQIHSLAFNDFRIAVNPKSVVGKALVLYLEADDLYLDVTFNSWSQDKQGGFAYTRSTED